MRAEKVDEYLEKYREYAARCDFLDKELKELRRLAEAMKASFVEDNVSVAQVMSSAPKGSSISDPTGRLGILAADGYTPDYIKDIENEIMEKQSEYEYKIPVVVFVESWLKVLTIRERFVVENKTIGCMFWRELVLAYKREFGEEYSRQGLKRIRDNAVSKIHKIAQ